MPSASKSATSSKDRRKSDKVESKNGSGLMVTLSLRPELLLRIFNGAPAPSIKEDSPPIKDTESPATSTTMPAAPPSNPENPSDSTPNTPTASGTPAPPSTMGPPIDGPKKRGVKRSAAGANVNGSDAPPKVRGKPGPKKKARLDDGTLDPGRSNGLGHKLGPKANQGAINAGLRALDRSGKPCRKWTKGGFQLKSFTGVVWNIPRWTAPPRPRPEADAPPAESASASAEGGSSNKENKEIEQIKSENSNSGGDVEMQSAPSLNANSPASLPIAAAS